MSKTAEQIRLEIEQSRGALAQNLEAIGERVSPKHLKEQVSDKVGEITDKVSPRRILGRQADKLKDGLSGVGDTVSGRAAEAMGSARGALGGTNGASQAASGAGRQAQTLTERVREASTSATGRLRAGPDANPMATALVAFGAGLVAGLALPPSNKERHTAAAVHDQVVEPLKQQAVLAGKAVADELQPAAQAKVKHVKRSATSAAERVRQEVKTSAEEVQGQVGAATEKVTGQARRAAKTTQARAASAADTTKPKAKRSAAAAKTAKQNAPSRRSGRVAHGGVAAV